MRPNLFYNRILLLEKLTIKPIILDDYSLIQFKDYNENI